jgi:hypothetical protein
MASARAKRELLAPLTSVYAAAKPRAAAAKRAAPEPGDEIDDTPLAQPLPATRRPPPLPRSVPARRRARAAVDTYAARWSLPKFSKRGTTTVRSATRRVTHVCLSAVLR